MYRLGVQHFEVTVISIIRKKKEKKYTIKHFTKFSIFIVLCVCCQIWAEMAVIDAKEL